MRRDRYIHSCLFLFFRNSSVAAHCTVLTSIEFSGASHVMFVISEAVWSSARGAVTAVRVLAPVHGQGRDMYPPKKKRQWRILTMMFSTTSLFFFFAIGIAFNFQTTGGSETTTGEWSASPHVTATLSEESRRGRGLRLCLAADQHAVGG